jgi:hypothetical protein
LACLSLSGGAAAFLESIKLFTCVRVMGPELRVSIYNMNGQLVRSYNDRYKNLMDVDVSSLQSGNYLIQITADGYIIGKRFAVVK